MSDVNMFSKARASLDMGPKGNSRKSKEVQETGQKLAALRAGSVWSVEKLGSRLVFDIEIMGREGPIIRSRCDFK